MGTLKKHALENPITIRLGKKGVVMHDKFCSEDITLLPGVMFDEGHYGFILIIEKDRDIVQKIYQTLCQLQGIQIFYEDGYFVIYEYGRTCPWKFTLSGDLIQEGKYVPTSIKDLEDAMEKFGASPKSNPEVFQMESKTPRKRSQKK